MQTAVLKFSANVKCTNCKFTNRSYLSIKYLFVRLNERLTSSHHAALFAIAMRMISVPATMAGTLCVICDGFRFTEYSCSNWSACYHDNKSSNQW